MTNEERRQYLSTMIPKAIDNHFEKTGFGKKSDFSVEMMKDIPREFYRYYGGEEKFISTFFNGEIWFSKPKEWDDDSDTTIYLSVEKEIRELENNSYASMIKLLHRVVNDLALPQINHDNLMPDAVLQEILECSFIRDQFLRNKFCEKMEQFGVQSRDAQNLGEQISKILNEIRRGDKFLDSTKKIWNLNNELRNSLCGVCFSEVYDDDHMWSEYGDGSKGFCVKYAIEPQKMSDDQIDLFTDFFPIYYGEKELISVLDLLASGFESQKKNINEATKAFFSKVIMNLCTKKTDWETQKEWRMWNGYSNLRANNVPFPFASAVYIGKNMPEKHREFVIAAACKNHALVFLQTMDSFSAHTLFIPYNVQK